MKCQARLEKAPNMSGIRHAGLVGKSERAKGTSHSKDQKREGKVLEVHKRDCVWPLEGSNVGTRSGGADDVASASSSSGVVCCCPESLVFL